MELQSFLSHLGNRRPGNEKENEDNVNNQNGSSSESDGRDFSRNHTNSSPLHGNYNNNTKRSLSPVPPLKKHMNQMFTIVDETSNITEKLSGHPYSEQQRKPMYQYSVPNGNLEFISEVDSCVAAQGSGSGSCSSTPAASPGCANEGGGGSSKDRSGNGNNSTSISSYAGSEAKSPKCVIKEDASVNAQDHFDKWLAEKKKNGGFLKAADGSQKKSGVKITSFKPRKRMSISGGCTRADVEQSVKIQVNRNGEELLLHGNDENASNNTMGGRHSDFGNMYPYILGDVGGGGNTLTGGVGAGGILGAGDVSLNEYIDIKLNGGVCGENSNMYLNEILNNNQQLQNISFQTPQACALQNTYSGQPTENQADQESVDKMFASFWNTVDNGDTPNREVEGANMRENSSLVIDSNLLCSPMPNGARSGRRQSCPNVAYHPPMRRSMESPLDSVPQGKEGVVTPRGSNSGQSLLTGRRKSVVAGSGDRRRRKSLNVITDPNAMRRVSDQISPGGKKRSSQTFNASDFPPNAGAGKYRRASVVSLGSEAGSVSSNVLPINRVDDSSALAGQLSLSSEFDAIDRTLRLSDSGCNNNATGPIGSRVDEEEVLEAANGTALNGFYYNNASVHKPGSTDDYSLANSLCSPDESVNMEPTGSFMVTSPVSCISSNTGSVSNGSPLSPMGPTNINASTATTARNNNSTTATTIISNSTTTTCTPLIVPRGDDNPDGNNTGEGTNSINLNDTGSSNNSDAIAINNMILTGDFNPVNTSDEVKRTLLMNGINLDNDICTSSVSNSPQNININNSSNIMNQTPQTNANHPLPRVQQAQQQQQHHPVVNSANNSSDNVMYSLSPIEVVEQEADDFLEGLLANRLFCSSSLVDEGQEGDEKKDLGAEKEFNKLESDFNLAYGKLLGKDEKDSDEEEEEKEEIKSPNKEEMTKTKEAKKDKKKESKKSKKEKEQLETFDELLLSSGKSQTSCSGCGIRFQHENVHGAGYIPREVLEDDGEAEMRQREHRRGAGKAVDEYMKWERLDRESSPTGKSAFEELGGAYANCEELEGGQEEERGVVEEEKEEEESDGELPMLIKSSGKKGNGLMEDFFEISERQKYYDEGEGGVCSSIEEQLAVLERNQRGRKLCTRCHCLKNNQAKLDDVFDVFQEHQHSSLMTEHREKKRIRGAGRDIDGDEYEFTRVLKSLKDTKAVILKVIDLTDVQGTFFADIVNYVNLQPMDFDEFVSRSGARYRRKVKNMTATEVGSLRRNWNRHNTKSQHELILVANKADAVMDLRSGSAFAESQKQRMRKWLVGQMQHHAREQIGEDSFIPKDFFTQIHFVSAQTGLGLGSLVRGIEKVRKGRNVVMVGTVSVGKSTLLNVLGGENFYGIPELVRMTDVTKKTKVKGASDRLTTSIVPGTTLKSLSFPIYPPRKFAAEDSPGWIWDRKALFIDTPGIMANRSGPVDKSLVKEMVQEKAAMYPEGEVIDKKRMRVWENEFEKVARLSSAVHLFAPSELKYTLLTKSTNYVFYNLKRGQSLLIGGFGRLDYVDGDPHTVKIGMMVNRSVEIIKTNIEKAPYTHERHVGTRVLSPPFFDPRDLLRSRSKNSQRSVNELQRIEQDSELVAAYEDRAQQRKELFPPLLRTRYDFQGVDSGSSCGEIVFSCAGWASVCTGRGHRVTLDAFMAGGVGLMVRDPVQPFILGHRQRQAKGPKVNGGAYGKAKRRGEQAKRKTN
eukprot:Nk52_evm11s1524 gene=Nk52_evmTU11s1524